MEKLAKKFLDDNNIMAVDLVDDDTWLGICDVTGQTAPVCQCSAVTRDGDKFAFEATPRAISYLV